jgi:hypothetical protein
MDSRLIFLFAAVLIVAGLLLAVIMLTKKGTTQLDVDKYRSRWLHIEQQLKRDSEASYSLCVLEADKLLDHALKAHGMRGETMGERMKNAKESWSNTNAVWSAHKLRNQIAHESGNVVTYDEARRALTGFKAGLKDIGAI